MRSKHSVECTTVAEIREKVEAAETLGLEVCEWAFYGAWDTADDCAVFPNRNKEVKKIGYKYLHVPLVGENGKQVCKIKPVDSTGVTDAGKVRIHFK